MVNIWTIAKREYSQYFSSPVAYAVAFFILLVVGAIFYFFGLVASANQQGSAPGVDIVTYPLATLLVLASPAITTRLLAEERRLGTIELLLTAPVRDWELIVGKWLGGLMLMLTILAVTIVYPIILNQMVKPGIDQGPLVTGYLGLILICAAAVAIGVFISSLFSNQIAAFAVTLGVTIFIWWILGPVVSAAGSVGPSADLVRYLDFNGHFTDNLVRGVIDLKDVVYYLSVTSVALLLGTVTVEARRWG